MNKLLTAVNFGSMALIALLLIAYLAVSGDDYEQALEDNAHWCLMIQNGTWYAGRDEIARRCAGILK